MPRNVRPLLPLKANYNKRIMHQMKTQSHSTKEPPAVALAGHADRLDRVGLERPELGGAEHLAEVDELEPEAQVGLVGAEPGHGLGVGERRYVAERLAGDGGGCGARGLLPDGPIVGASRRAGASSGGFGGEMVDAAGPNVPRTDGSDRLGGPHGRDQGLDADGAVCPRVVRAELGLERLKPGDVPEGCDADSYYSRGIAIY